MIDSVRDSSVSELDVDFGFGAGRLTGSIERSVGASLVASLEVFELESGARKRLASSFKEFLSHVADKVEDGNLE